MKKTKESLEVGMLKGLFAVNGAAGMPVIGDLDTETDFQIGGRPLKGAALNFWKNRCHLASSPGAWPFLRERSGNGGLFGGIFASLQRISMITEIKELSRHILWAAVVSEFPEVQNYRGGFIIHTGGIVGVSKSSTVLTPGIENKGGMVEKFFPNLNDVMCGKKVFGDKPQFLEVPEGEIVGKVTDEIGRQLICLSSAVKLARLSESEKLGQFSAEEIDRHFAGRSYMDYMRWRDTRGSIANVDELAAKIAFSYCVSEAINMESLMDRFGPIGQLKLTFDNEFNVIVFDGDAEADMTIFAAV